MRITGGEKKNMRLKVPPDRTRPTPAMVRQAIFDMLGPAVLDGEVLDLFAGSGSLGIEALSRGARNAIFVEECPLSCRIIKENLVSTGYIERARVLKRDVFLALESLARRKSRFDIVFMDPPYDKGFEARALDAIGSMALLKPEAWVVVEHSKREALFDANDFLNRQRHRLYGDTAISLYETALKEEYLT